MNRETMRWNRAIWVQAPGAQNEDVEMVLGNRRAVSQSP